MLIHSKSRQFCSTLFIVPCQEVATEPFLVVFLGVNGRCDFLQCMEDFSKNVSNLPTVI